MATTLQGAVGGVDNATESRGSWRDIVAPYQQTEVNKAIVQLVCPPERALSHRGERGGA